MIINLHKGYMYKDMICVCVAFVIDDEDRKFPCYMRYLIHVFIPVSYFFWIYFGFITFITIMMIVVLQDYFIFGAHIMKFT